MFQRFTDRARSAVLAAQDSAVALGHDFIGCEHLLLGLAVDPTGVAGQVLGAFDLGPDELRRRIGGPSPVSDSDALASLGIDLDAVRRQLEASFGEGVMAAPVRVPFTPLARAALEGSVTQASELQHDYIGTEHMLLGVLDVEESRVTDLVEGVDLDAMRHEVLVLAAPDHLRIQAAELKLSKLQAEWEDPQVRPFLVRSGTARSKLSRVRAVAIKAFADELEVVVADAERTLGRSL